MNAERRFSLLVRELPLRRAPVALESRVCRELERRAARPWWFHVFSRWPGGAKASFVVVCAAFIALTLGEGTWALVIRMLGRAAAAPSAWSHTTIAIIGSTYALWASLTRAIPATWIYYVLAVGTVLYAALFGLSATAYRTLFLQPSSAGNSR